MLWRSGAGKRAMGSSALLRWAQQPGDAVLWLFLLLDNLVCDALGAHEDDGRDMIRTLINMLVWNLVAVLIVVGLW